MHIVEQSRNIVDVRSIPEHTARECRILSQRASISSVKQTSTHHKVRTGIKDSVGERSSLDFLVHSVSTEGGVQRIGLGSVQVLIIVSKVHQAGHASQECIREGDIHLQSICTISKLPGYAEGIHNLTDSYRSLEQ